MCRKFASCYFTYAIQRCILIWVFLLLVGFSYMALPDVGRRWLHMLLQERWTSRSSSWQQLKLSQAFLGSQRKRSGNSFRRLKLVCACVYIRMCACVYIKRILTTVSIRSYAIHTLPMGTSLTRSKACNLCMYIHMYPLNNTPYRIMHALIIVCLLRIHTKYIHI